MPIIMANDPGIITVIITLIIIITVNGGRPTGPDRQNVGGSETLDLNSGISSVKSSGSGT